MKNQLFLKLVIAGCMAFSGVKAQTVNEVKLSELQADYLEVSEYRQILSKKTFISVDYGQKRDKSDFRELIVRDDNGNYLAYNSVVDFVNKMELVGYELFQVYTITSGEKSSPKYVLKRKLIK